MAMGLEARVTVLEQSLQRLYDLDLRFGAYGEAVVGAETTPCNVSTTWTSGSAPASTPAIRPSKPSRSG